MEKYKLQRLSEEYFLLTHPDGRWEIIHEERINQKIGS